MPANEAELMEIVQKTRESLAKAEKVSAAAAATVDAATVD
jgi:hypothetical protein